MEKNTYHDYFHNDNNNTKSVAINDKEGNLIARVNKIWYSSYASKG